MLTDGVAWHVPGRSAIAGDYRGRDEVLRYFTTRRELASATIRIEVHGVLADDQRAVILAEGHMGPGGETSSWKTVAVFRMVEGRIAECLVLPYDQRAYEEIWLKADRLQNR